MIIQTEKIKEVASNIANAINADKNIANIELLTRNNAMYLSVTNKEYYVSCKFDVDTTEESRAVVDATALLGLVAGINTPTFEITWDDLKVTLTVGKSSYKIPLVMGSNGLLEVKPIVLDTVSTNMEIPSSTLKSILDINGKEVDKLKGIAIDELKQLYFIDETGCITFNTSGCYNRFTLPEAIRLILNKRTVKLFKLFKDEAVDVHFTYGASVGENGMVYPKAAFQTDNIYIATLLTNDDTLASKMIVNATSIKEIINENRLNSIVLNVNDSLAAVNRLMTFIKNTSSTFNVNLIPIKCIINESGLTIMDTNNNVEILEFAEDCNIQEYAMTLNLVDLKSVLESCKTSHITLNCGNHRNIVINHGVVSNAITELKF